MTLTVVLDTNVIVSAALNADGAPAAVIDAWLIDDRFAVITSATLLNELIDVIGRPHLRGRFAVRATMPNDVVAALRSRGVLVEPEVRLDVVPRDPTDNRVVEAAVAGEADYIVSGDGDLRSLESVEGIPVVSPAEFIAILDADGQ